MLATVAWYGQVESALVSPDIIWQQLHNLHYIMTWTNIELVDRFYRILWNANDRSIAPRLLHPELEFRGAVGIEVKGIEGFLGYMDRMLETFPDFSTEVLTLVGGEDGTVVSRQVYRGTHRGNFFEVPPTGRQVEYSGVGFFEFKSGYIRKVWVLGDVLGVYRQLGWKPCSSRSDE